MVDRPKSSLPRTYREWQNVHAEKVAQNISEELKFPQNISGSSKWQMYRTNAIDYLYQDYAPIFELGVLLNRIGKRRESGQQVTVLDAAGAADAYSIGATHTINVVLQKNQEIEKLEGPHRTFIAGDICRGETQATVFRTVDAIDAEGLDCIFFQPGSAFSLEDQNEYVSARLFTFLSLLLTKLKVGGELFSRLDTPHNRGWFKPVAQSLNPTIGEQAVMRDSGEIRLDNGMRFFYEFAIKHPLVEEDEEKTTWDTLLGGSRMYVHLRRLE